MILGEVPDCRVKFHFLMVFSSVKTGTKMTFSGSRSQMSPKHSKHVSDNGDFLLLCSHSLEVQRFLCYIDLSHVLVTFRGAKHDFSSSIEFR